MEEKNIVARINEKEISKDDVMQFLNDIGPQVAMQFQSPEGIEKVVIELVNQELLLIEAEEDKIEDDDEFKEILEQNRNVLLKNYALNKLIRDVDASEEEMKKYYEDNKAQFKKAEMAKASHILVKTKEEAEDILEKINKGMTFEEAAEKYSTCPSSEKGGDLGEFERGQMVPEFEEVAFSMEEGAISELVKTQFGYHIIKLIHRSKAEELAFENIKENIYEQVVRKKQQTKYIEKIDELKAKNKVEIM